MGSGQLATDQLRNKVIKPHQLVNKAQMKVDRLINWFICHSSLVNLAQQSH